MSHPQSPNPKNSESDKEGDYALDGLRFDDQPDTPEELRWLENDPWKTEEITPGQQARAIARLEALKTRVWK